MQCPQCQHLNPDGSQWCHACGAELERLCSACHHINPAGSRFCNACGHGLSDASGAAQAETPLVPDPGRFPTAPSGPEAERRQLTVMFCDLVGSTPLSGQLDPEDLRDVVRAYQEMAAEVILGYEGYIAQYLGDGLLVYFGFPLAHEDEAQRAVYTGLGIAEAMTALNTRLEAAHGVQLSVRIGIHTGPVVVGEMGGGGRHESLALGETTNIAARLEGLAQPDTVVISEATYRLAAGYVEADDLGEQNLKGVAIPMHVYQVRQAAGDQGRPEMATRRGLTPLVAREPEVEWLLERWAQVQAGHGHVVLLSGEAGIGKSRLVQVLKDRVAQTPHIRLECRSSPYYRNTALYPLINLLPEVLGWQPDDTSEQRLARLEQALSPHAFAWPEAVVLIASLLSLPVPAERYPPLELAPQRQRQKTLETLLALLFQQADPHPVLFIAEDLHWTDPTTLEWLTQLIEQVPAAPLLTVLTSRPEFESPWGLRPALTSIALSPLTPSQIETMVGHVTAGKRLPAVVMQHLVEKTDGVPLFIEEMTRAILESGVLQGEGDHFELTGVLSSLAIPMSLQDALMGRLDRLGAAKEIAQLGATLGRTFSYELLQAVSDLDARVLRRRLHELVGAELLDPKGHAPHLTFTFKHALIQETAYASLLKRRRRQIHARIAQVLTEQFPETAEAEPERVAHHWTEAAYTAQAVSYWERASSYARTRSALAEAVAHGRKGLALVATLPDTPERAQQELLLQCGLGLAWGAAKGYAAPEVGQAFDRARALSEQVEGTPPLELLTGLQGFYLARAELRTARELAEQLLNIAPSLQDGAVVQGHTLLGATLLLQGELPAARVHLEQGIVLHEPRLQRPLGPSVLTGMDSRSWAAWTLWLLGYPNQALEQVLSALALAQEVGHPFALAFTLFFTTLLYQFRREVQSVRERAETAITLSSEREYVFWVTQATICRGWALAMQGQEAEGVAQIHGGLDSWRITGTEVARPYALALLAEGYGQMRQIDFGLQALAEALELVSNTGGRWVEAEIYRSQGELLWRRSPSDEDEAEHCFHRALEIAGQQQAKSWELRAATSLARLWQRQDKGQAAHDLLAPVYEWFTEGFDTADLQDAKRLLDELNAE